MFSLGNPTCYKKAVFILAQLALVAASGNADGNCAVVVDGTVGDMGEKGLLQQKERHEEHIVPQLVAESLSEEFGPSSSPQHGANLLELDSERQDLRSNTPSFLISDEQRDKMKASYLSNLEAAAMAQTQGSVGQTCFNASGWLADFAKQRSWKKYSQGDQDAVFDSLFSASALGTTDKQYVEFGFPEHSLETSYGNGRYLQERFGFKPCLLIDGKSENHTINLHRHFITADNIVGIFDSHGVPEQLDYASIDIDSCDLWVFFALTKKYKPRMVTVEYNSNYAWGDFSTQRCAAPMAKGAYFWHRDNIYGASLNAIELAARHRQYTLVYVSPMLDTFFVRDDLICPGTAPPAEIFKAAAGLPTWPEYKGRFGPKEELLMDFRTSPEVSA